MYTNFCLIGFHKLFTHAFFLSLDRMTLVSNNEELAKFLHEIDLGDCLEVLRSELHVERLSCIAYYGWITN